MRTSTLIGILWIIGLIYFPIGIWLIQEINTLLSITIGFIGIIFLIIYTLYITFNKKQLEVIRGKNNDK